MMNKFFPEHLKYDKNYSWVKIEGDLITVGVNYLASKKVKEFVFIKLPEKGEDLKKGDVYVSLEAIKWSGHLTSPVSGKVIEVNKSLFSKPSKLNESPYEEWIMKMKVDDIDELNSLMDASKVKDFYSEHLD